MLENEHVLRPQRAVTEDWARKIEIAKQAREAGKALRGHASGVPTAPTAKILK